MTTSNIKSSDIRSFVRERLGCSCPNEVFSKIRVTHNPDPFKSTPVDYLIEIGGRLLVTISTQDWHATKDALDNIFKIGKAYRDSHGFNRFRLVVATSDSDAQPSLGLAFGSLTVKDEKTHLHIIDPADLPEHMNAWTN
jgi:hypothetical protein